MLKIAVSGKGGVGKTTVSGMLTATLGLQNHRVIAIDADPDSNLPCALGVPPNVSITPLSEMRDLIEQRTGSKANYGGYFKLNPKVDDIPDQYALHIGPDIHLLTLGGVKVGGGGCICPASALLKALLVHLIIGTDDALVMDMEAGIEHLGRATGQSMDAMIIVVNDTPWSFQTAHRVRKLASDISIENLFVVANRVDDSTDLKQISDALDGLPVIGRIPDDPRLQNGLFQNTDTDNPQPTEAMKDHLPRMEKILTNIQNRM